MTERRETALILGAGTGLGKCIAEECRNRGWRTIEVARFRGGNVATSERARDGGLTLVASPRVTTPDRATLTADLADGPGTIISALCGLRDDGWIPTMFFWVAGQWWTGPFEIMDSETLATLLDVNLRNALIVGQHVWSEFLRTTEPRTFVTIASTSGLTARNRETAYVATKFAQVGATRALGLEAEALATEGRVRGRIPGERYVPDIRVRLFCPGEIRTDLFESDGRPRPKEYGEFMDPAKVATHLVTRSVSSERWIEEAIDRESEFGQSLR